MKSSAAQSCRDQYRRSPSVRRLQWLEYAKTAGWLVMLILTFTGLAFLLGAKNPERAGLVLGWAFFVTNAAINMVIYDWRFGVRDIAMEWAEQDQRALQRLQEYTRSSVEQLADDVIASAMERAAKPSASKSQAT